jgi:hypothetical protein
VNRILPGVRRLCNGRAVDRRRARVPLRRCAAQPGVHVTGFVTDVRPYLNGCRGRSPVRFGSGFRARSWKLWRCKCRWCTLAAGGLRTEEGAEPPLDLATDEASFAAALAAHLATAARGALPSATARRYVEEHFTWSASAAKLEAILRRVAQSRIATVRGR